MTVEAALMPDESHREQGEGGEVEASPTWHGPRLRRAPAGVCLLAWVTQGMTPQRCHSGTFLLWLLEPPEDSTYQWTIKYLVLSRYTIICHQSGLLKPKNPIRETSPPPPRKTKQQNQNPERNSNKYLFSELHFSSRAEGKIIIATFLCSKIFFFLKKPHAFLKSRYKSLSK